MSDNFQMLVDPDATLEEANQLRDAVLNRFREMRLITGTATGECVLGGKGYRLGPAVPKLYILKRNECAFWELTASGVEPKVGRHFNIWAVGPDFQGLTCPKCDGQFEALDDAFKDVFGQALGDWYHQSGPALFPCPRCGKTPSVTEWHCKPPLGFGNLSFTFWNWPPLDSRAWKIDIMALVEEITGHKLVSTHGHI
jgi:hypothetical protein